MAILIITLFCLVSRRKTCAMCRRLVQFWTTSKDFKRFNEARKFSFYDDGDLPAPKHGGDSPAPKHDGDSPAPKQKTIDNIVVDIN